MSDKIIDSIKKVFAVKNFMRSFLAVMWSAYCMAYFWRSSFQLIPPGSEQLVNIICGMLIGTIVGGIFGYYFATSQSSTEKNEMIKDQIPPVPQSSSTVKQEISTTVSNTPNPVTEEPKTDK